jgi:hypothetical protein
MSSDCQLVQVSFLSISFLPVFFMATSFRDLNRICQCFRLVAALGRVDAVIRVGSQRRHARDKFSAEIFLFG